MPYKNKVQQKEYMKNLMNKRRRPNFFRVIPDVIPVIPDVIPVIPVKKVVKIITIRNDNSAFMLWVYKNNKVMWEMQEYHM